MNIHHFKCGKCDNGTIKIVVKETKNQVSTNIYSCDKYNYRYGFKEFQNLEEIITYEKLRLEKLNIGDTYKYNLNDVGIFKVLKRVDENWIESVRIQSGRIAGNFPDTEVYPLKDLKPIKK